MEQRRELGSWLRNRLAILGNAVTDASVGPIEIGSRPVFIVGCGHSGTTLVATLLYRHDDCFVVGDETNLFLPAVGLRCARRTLVILDAIAIQAGASFLVEKTPKHILCVPRIFRLLPNARIVVVTRDGRDVACSLRKRLGRFDVAVDRWVSDNRAVLGHLADSRVHHLRYEDLVEDPVSTLTGLMSFMGSTLQPGMLAGGQTPYQASLGTGGFSTHRARQVSQGIYDDRGRWRQEMSPPEERYFWKRAGGVMRRLDYA